MKDNKFASKHNAIGHKQDRATSYAQASKGCRCPHCGSVISEHSELCPVCMHPVHSDSCTFCGAVLLPDDRFCPDCGNPVQGVTCPKCGTVNFRNFCYKCHEPLTSHAQDEIARAHSDPAYQKMIAVAKELAALEEVVSDALNGGGPEKDTLTSEDIELINKYRSLISELSNNDIQFREIPEKEKNKPEKKSVQKPVPAEAMARYRQKTQEMNDILKEFAPAPDATPQMQRDYYSARKIPVIITTRQKARSGWVCNYCGFFHNVPEECAEPWHGGNWQYTEIEVSSEKWVNED